MKEDQEFNIQFVQVVEKYPELYDINHPSYSKRSATQSAWNNVSKEVKVTVKDCKYRWKILRVSLARSLRQKTQNEKGDISRKPYYLSEYMQFVIPFTRVSVQPEVNDLESYGSSDDDCTSSHVDIESSSIESQDQKSPESKCSSKEDKTKRDLDIEDSDTSKKPKIDKIIEKSELTFFNSLLPELCKMDADQRTRFRMIMQRTIKEILGSSASEDTPDLN